MQGDVTVEQVIEAARKKYRDVSVFEIRIAFDHRNVMWFGLMNAWAGVAIIAATDLSALLAKLEAQ